MKNTRKRFYALYWTVILAVCLSLFGITAPVFGNPGWHSTATPTKTSIPSATATNTKDPSPTPSNTTVPSQTSTNTQIPTATPSPTETLEPSSTPTNTDQPTSTPSETEKPSQTPTDTSEPSATPTDTESPSQTPTSTEKPTETATVKPQGSPTATGTGISTPTPTATIVDSPTPTNTAVSSPTASPSATLGSSPTPTDTPVITQTPTETTTPGETPTPTETVTVPPPTETEASFQPPTAKINCDGLLVTNNSRSGISFVTYWDGLPDLFMSRDLGVFQTIGFGWGIIVDHAIHITIDWTDHFAHSGTLDLGSFGPCVELPSPTPPVKVRSEGADSDTYAAPIGHISYPAIGLNIPISHGSVWSDGVFHHALKVAGEVTDNDYGIHQSFAPALAQSKPGDRLTINGQFYQVTQVVIVASKNDQIMQRLLDGWTTITTCTPNGWFDNLVILLKPVISTRHLELQ